MYSSFHGQTAKSSATKHNNREQPPKYLLEHDNKELNDFISYINNRDDVLTAVQELVKNKTGRTMQEKAKKAFWQEAVINCKKDTQIEDIENLFKKLNEHFGGGFEVAEIAIHRDEGAFIETSYNLEDIKRDSKTGVWFTLKDGLNISNEVKAYMPNENIFYNQDTKKWYLDKDFTTEKDTKDLQKYFNYHAHAIYNKFDYANGKNIRLKKSDLQTIQDITAEYTKLERTKPSSKFARRNHNQQKYFYQEVDNQTLPLAVKNQELAKQKDLNEEITKLRTELKQENAKREDYAKLEQLNRDLKERIKQKDLTIDDLKEIIDANSKEKEHLKSIIEVKEIDNIDLKNQNKSLQEQKTVLNDKLVELEKKNDSRPNMSDLEVNNQLQKIVNDEIEEKEIKTGLFSSEKAPVIKNHKSFFEKIKDLALKGAETVAKEFLELKTKYSDLVIKFNAVTKENAELKAKVKTLESERSSAPKQQKENAMESIKNLMSETNDKKGEKSLKEFLEKKAKEKDKKSNENYRNR